MKALIVAVIFFFVPSLSSASRDCSSIGGTCKFNCTTDEYTEPGYYLDCSNKQVCCTKSTKPTGTKEMPKNTERPPSQPRDTVSTPGETSTKSSVSGEVGGTSKGKAGQILVCSPLTDTYANADTLLECGSRNATLNNLYEENYRLIQIISAKKVLYYLERR